MKISERIKSLLLNGFGVLALNLVFQRDWGPVIFGVVIFIIGALTLPYLFTFMRNEKRDNLYK